MRLFSWEEDLGAVIAILLVWIVVGITLLGDNLLRQAIIVTGGFILGYWGSKYYSRMRHK